MDDDWIIAVDGGGTSCRLVLERPGEVITTELGAANVSTGFDRAIAVLTDGLEALASGAAVPLDALRPVPAYLGLAGVTGPDMAARVAARLPLDNLRVEEDRAAAVRGALGDRDGAVVLCGTGSFVALRRGDRLRCIGGWGPVLGDEASAHWLGLRALRAGLAEADGLAPPSELSRRLTQELGDPAAFIALSIAGPQSRIAALAPLVTAAAGAGCPRAGAILTEAAGWIADTLTAIGRKAADPICLTGGIGPIYASRLPPGMAARLVAPIGTPLDGARALARDFARSLTL